MEKTKKVAVAMSGGVDSGVVTALVVRTGYQAAGFHLRFWQEPRAYPRGSLGRHPGGVTGGFFSAGGVLLGT